MKQIRQKEAEVKFLDLIKLASQGEEIVITHADGSPMVRIVSCKQRVGGQLEGKLKISDDFDDPLPEDVEKDFEGKK